MKSRRWRLEATPSVPNHKLFQLSRESNNIKFDQNRPRSACWILAETGWKILFWLNCCEIKILFRLKKQAEQAEYGVSRTRPIHFWHLNGTRIDVLRLMCKASWNTGKEASMGYSRFIIAVLPIPMDGAICKPTCGSGNLRPHCSERGLPGKLASWILIPGTASFQRNGRWVELLLLRCQWAVSRPFCDVWLNMTRAPGVIAPNWCRSTPYFTNQGK